MLRTLIPPGRTSESMNAWYHAVFCLCQPNKTVLNEYDKVCDHRPTSRPNKHCSPLLLPPTGLLFDDFVRQPRLCKVGVPQVTSLPVAV